MTELADRAQRIAEQAKRRSDATFERSITRDWYSIRRPGCEPIAVCFNPPQTQAEVLARYPGCGVVPL